MKAREIFLFIIGVTLIGFGALIVLGSVLMFDDPESKRSLVELFFLSLIFGIAPLGAGVLLCRRMLGRSSARKLEQNERIILELARDNQGSLTVSEVTMALPISSTEAKRLLEECHLKDLATIGVGENGAVVYDFHLR